jgi:hypothetical protein
MLTAKENALLAISGQTPEYVPLADAVDPFLVSATGDIEGGIWPATDAFGVTWIATKEGAIPDHSKFHFSDINEWRAHVSIPNPDDYDFTAYAERDLAGIYRDTQLVNVINTAGLFDRIVSLMGFEDALIAFVTDTEAIKDFYGELTAFKIRMIERIVDAYKPDMITYFDDVATANGLFIKPDTWREVIMPFERQIGEAIRSQDVIFNRHLCGKAEDIIDDLVEIGVQVWNSAQIMNDLAAIQQRHQGELCIEGGWDSTGPVSFAGASTEAVIEEAKRCIATYGVNRNYICGPLLMNERGNAALVGDERIDALKAIWPEISRIF